MVRGAKFYVFPLDLLKSIYYLIYCRMSTVVCGHDPSVYIQYACLCTVTYCWECPQRYRQETTHRPCWCNPARIQWQLTWILLTG